MRDLHAASNPLAGGSLPTLGVAVLLAVALSACAAPRMGPGGPSGAPRLVPPGLFISPFGEPFAAAPDQPWPVADWFVGADENLDGVIVFDEFAADGRRWFDQLDTDRDGRLGQAELWAYEARLAELGGARGGGDGERGGERRGGRGPQSRPAGATLGLAQQRPGGGRNQRGGAGRGSRGYGRVAEAGFFNLPQPVKAADVNVDQRVTTEEWAAATQRWFLALDTDRDGRLTLATLPKTPLQQQAKARR